MMMMKPRLALWAAVALAVQSSSMAEERQQSAASTPSSSSPQEEQCGLYLAPSSKSTAGDFKWGLYTAETLEAGAAIGGAPFLAVPVHRWRAQHHFPRLPPEEREYWHHLSQFVSNYLWQADVAGAQGEYDDSSDDDSIDLADASSAIGVAIPGPGFLAAFGPSPRSNADWDRAEAHRRIPSMGAAEAGRDHPNRGALSPWNRVTLRATKAVPAGSEVVVHYDDPLLAGSPLANDDEEDEEADEHAVTSDDYRKIDETIHQMLQFFDKHSANLDDGARDQIYRFLVQDFMEAAVGPIKARRVAELFPPGPAELAHVTLAGGIKNYSNDTSRVQMRRVEWLRSSGYCYDHLKPGPSTVPDAGLGGFATRRIPKGSVVVPVPLLHIADEKALDMYDLYEDGTGVAGSSVRGKQLLTNYVLGHTESTMVFLPASSAVYLNHNATPNARLRWASESQVGHQNADWIEVSPPDLATYDAYYTVGLLMEVVALRDIEAGEEVFLSYGPEWEAAWKKHADAWAKDEGPSEWPLGAADLNERYRTTPFPTEDELKKGEAYPDHVALKAFLVLDGDAAGEEEGTADDPYTYAAPALPTESDAAALFEVTVVSRRQAPAFSGTSDSAYTSYLYTVKVDAEDEDEIDNGEDTASYVKQVPHSALVFVDRPGTSDHFRSSSAAAKRPPFRHVIGIPDDVFPKGTWRNRPAAKKKAQS